MSVTFKDKPTFGAIDFEHFSENNNTAERHDREYVRINAGRYTSGIVLGIEVTYMFDESNRQRAHHGSVSMTPDEVRTFANKLLELAAEQDAVEIEFWKQRFGDRS